MPQRTQANAQHGFLVAVAQIRQLVFALPRAPKLAANNA
jgi:hypothetical protein